MPSAGNQTVRLVARKRRKTSQNGYVTTWFYEGAKAAIEIAEFSDAYIAGAVDVDAEYPPGPHARLAITFANIDGITTEDILSNVWSLPGNEIQQRIFDHPKALELEAAHPGWLRIIEKEVEAYIAGDTTAAFGLVATFDPGVGAIQSKINPPATKADNAEELAADLRRGVESYGISQYVLRNVRTVPAESSLTAVHTNVQDMFTTAQLATEAVNNYGGAIPNALLGTFPSTGYWQKKSPSVEQTSNGKWQLIQEWWYVNDFSTFAYETVT